MSDDVRLIVREEIAAYFRNGMNILLKRSKVKGRIPPSEVMREGEPAVNLPDKRLYVKTDENTVSQINTIMEKYNFSYETQNPTIVHNRGTDSFTYQIFKRDGTQVFAGMTLLSNDAFRINFERPVRDFSVVVIFN